jgi:dienelactone hydrolase
MKAILFIFAGALATALPALAEIKTETIVYSDGDTTLEGFVAYDDAIKEPHPGVLVVHDWTGLQDYTQTRARQLAELGYTAFAVDIFGKGVRPNDPAACAAEANKYKTNLPLFRRRLQLGITQLKAMDGVDEKKLGAIGYCFGGTGVLELARSGAELRAVISFHGGLATTMPAQPGKVHPFILVCHGADDPFVKPPEVAAFKAEMAKAQAKMKFVPYPGAVHSFTKPAAGNDPKTGQAYNEAADKASWAEMKQFLTISFK